MPRERPGFGIQLRISEEMNQQIEAWRDSQALPPSKTAVVLRLLEMGLERMAQDPEAMYRPREATTPPARPGRKQASG